MQDNVKSLDESGQLPKHVQDLDGKVYERLVAGQVKRLSPKLKGKERRLARQIAKMTSGNLVRGIDQTNQMNQRLTRMMDGK